MKTLTICIEVPDERASEVFHELVEECADSLASADEETLVVRLRELETK